MNPKSLTTLEYDKIIARLAALCETPAGRAPAAPPLPPSDSPDALRRQRLTAEARRLLDMKPGLSLAPARDVRALVHQAAPGHVLEPPELLDVHATLTLARQVRDTINRLRVPLPLLAETADAIGDFSDVLTEIARCINPRAEVVDTPSPPLAHLRRDSRHPPARPS